MEICGTCGSTVDELQGACRACNGSSDAEEDPPAPLAKEIDHVEVKRVDMVHILEQLEAEARSLADPRLQDLRRRQADQQGRFLNFEQKQKWVMWTRHGQKKVEMLDGHADLEQSMRKRVRQLPSPSLARMMIDCVYVNEPFSISKPSMHWKIVM